MCAVGTLIRTDLPFAFIIQDYLSYCTSVWNFAYDLSLSVPLSLSLNAAATTTVTVTLIFQRFRATGEMWRINARLLVETFADLSCVIYAQKYGRDLYRPTWISRYCFHADLSSCFASRKKKNNIYCLLYLQRLSFPLFPFFNVSCLIGH